MVYFLFGALATAGATAACLAALRPIGASARRRLRREGHGRLNQKSVITIMLPTYDFQSRLVFFIVSLFFLGCFCALRKNLVFFTVHFTLFDEKSPDYSQNLDGPLFSLTLLSSFFQKTRERQRPLPDLADLTSWRTTLLTSARMRMSAARRG